ncbi:PREDICTED: bone marrow proteoglycan [Condylura cristata]|uniref:bone marrow proteoglycan n=1 Tax=Condylura cristata TaxID=143302 RepID=UPI000642DACE|nr:PREDICTED: bone marrow proteoglycan [Condylura cristata]
MNLPVLLALLLGAASALHLRTPNFESPGGDESQPQNGETAEHEAKEVPGGELTQLSIDEDGGSGSECALEEERAVKAISDLGTVDKSFQCPKKEDTVELVGSPGYKTYQRYLLVRQPMNFNYAQYTCQCCYRGQLTSVHNFNFNNHLQCLIRGLNYGQVWIGGLVTGVGHCRRFRWMDNSSWNFGYWAPGQPAIYNGHCVTLCTRGGQWRLSHCYTQLPFICSY